MKLPLLLPLLLGMLTAPAAQALTTNEAQGLFSAAEEAYAQGDHAQAMSLFDSVATVYSSASLYYNLGNCHFKLGDIPRAILNYERALRLEPGAEDVQANLDLARLQVVDRMNELPGFALGATWGKLRGGKDVDQWARRAMWGSLLFFVLLAGSLFVSSRWLRTAALGFAAATFLFTAASSGFAAWRTAEVRDTSEAIILTPKVDIRSAPNSSATVLFVLHKGTKVGVQQVQEGWLEVGLPNGSVGWMPESDLERI
jgi:tetratricopeptide (TPR) repeat protein